MADTVSGNTSTNAVVGVGGSVTGAIDTGGDQDWYRVSLVAGRQYRFDLQGSDSGQGTLDDPLLRLLNASGVELDESDDISQSNHDSRITFAVSQNGTYFLSAQAFENAIGTFRLSVTDLGPGGSVDVPGNTSSTSSVAVGSSVTGTIDIAGDTDWYRVSLVAGRQYRFDLQGLDSGQGTLQDPFLQLLDGLGGWLDESDDASQSNHDSSITFTPSQSGTYFLSAEPFDLDSQTGTYRLSVTDLTGGSSDVAGNTGTTSSVAVGGSATGTIDTAGDEDWYRVSLTSGHQYRFDLQGLDSGQGTLGDPLLRLLDGSGSELDENDDINSPINHDSSITFTAFQSGTYFLSAQAFQDAIGTFRLSVTDLGGGSGDVPDNTNTTSSVVVGGSVAGSIGFVDDMDWYRVSLTAGRQYRFDLQGSESGQGTLEDPFLDLFDGSGEWLAASDDISGSNHDSSIAFAALQSGTYFLSASSSDLISQGTFRLSATDIGVAVPDVPGDTSTSSAVTVGGSITGSIDIGGDLDWYRIALIGGHQYRFDLRGSTSGQGTLEDTWLTLLDASSTELDYDDGALGTGDSSITYAASQSGTYYLSAEPSDLYFGVGTYRLSAIDLGAVGSVDVPGNTSSTSSVAVGGSVTGTIGASGDEDWYRVSLVAGHQYRVDLGGADSGQGTLSDPVLRLLNGSGVQIDYDDDVNYPINHDSSITFTAPQSGVYFLSAEGFDPAVGTFRLDVTDIGGSGASTDTVPADPSTTRSVSMGGSVTVTIDAGGDQDWYRASLTAGRQYRFDLRDVGSGQGGDPYLRLLDGQGVELALNDDSGGTLNSSIVYVPTQSGTYFLSAQAFDVTTGTFLLSATDLGSGGPADVPGNTTTTSMVQPGSSATGSIETAGDQDWYRVSLVAGRQYRFELQGAPTSQGTLGDPQLRLLDGSGSELVANDNAGGTLNSSIPFTSTQSTDHFLSAQGVGGNTGTYTLRVIDLAGGSGSGTIEGTPGNDPLERLTGDSHNNTIRGLEGNDALDGKGGDDSCDGGPGNDSLNGGDGNDTLVGGAGNDSFADVGGSNNLQGGDGDDLFNVDVSGSTVTGGLGRDRYNVSPAFSARDYVVTDFAAGTNGDFLDVRTLLAASASVGAYSAGHADPFASGVLRWVQSGPDALLQWDKDGAAGPLYSPTTQITLRNVAYTSITSDNYVSDSVQGTKDDNVLVTGLGNDTLSGLEGNDTLDGSLGRDTMAGGSGSDTYYVESLGDVIQEVSNAQQGLALVAPFALEGFIDTVIAAISYSLANVANVENLLLAAASAAAAGTGNELDNVLTGNALNNTLTGLGGNDTLDGGQGADTAVCGGSRAAYALSGAAPNFTVSGPDGSDTLVSIERLQFSDHKIAFDLGAGQAAGNTVRIIGAAFDAPLIIPDYVGIGLQFFDGGMSMPAVCQQVAQLMGMTNTAFVSRVYTNVMGTPPDPVSLNTFVGLLQGSGGNMTQGQLLEVAANVGPNAINIDLAGLLQTGVEFV